MAAIKIKHTPRVANTITFTVRNMHKLVLFEFGLDWQQFVIASQGVSRCGSSKSTSTKSRSRLEYRIGGNSNDSLSGCIILASLSLLWLKSGELRYESNVLAPIGSFGFLQKVATSRFSYCLEFRYVEFQ